jgi:hypothetical protein
MRVIEGNHNIDILLDVMNLAELKFSGPPPPDFARHKHQRAERKGDITLLQKRDGSLYASVPFSTAESYLGISARQRQKLQDDGRLKVIGKGLNRRITVESLMEYCPPREDTDFSDA